MPKHPFWFLGFPSRQTYRAATENVFRGVDDDDKLIRDGLMLLLSEKYPNKYKKLKQWMEIEYNIHMALLMTLYETNLPVNEKDDGSMVATDANTTVVAAPSPVPAVVSEVDNDSVYVNSFQLLWERDHGRRVRFVIRNSTAADTIVHIDAYKDVVRIRPNQTEVKNVLFANDGAFFGNYIEQVTRVCNDCFDLYPTGYERDILRLGFGVNPDRVLEIKTKIRNFLKNKLVTSTSVFPNTDEVSLTGTWTSYRTLEITGGNETCTIEVSGSTNEYTVRNSTGAAVMGNVEIRGTSDTFNERVMRLFDEVCVREDGALVAAPKDQKTSAWKVMYDLSKRLTVEEDVLDLQNLLDDEEHVYEGTATEDTLYSSFDDMTTTPADSLFLKFDDTTQHNSSLTYSTPMTYNGGIGPLGDVFAEM